mmetsp:Transcript_11201/g.26096  ORF Transcript_11201/g.26096 Transcript_11201/m.26096 type:complete len:226 (+) Transcript_11201:300-977(+)
MLAPPTGSASSGTRRILPRSGGGRFRVDGRRRGRSQGGTAEQSAMAKRASIELACGSPTGDAIADTRESWQGSQVDYECAQGAGGLVWCGRDGPAWRGVAVWWWRVAGGFDGSRSLQRCRECRRCHGRQGGRRQGPRRRGAQAVGRARTAASLGGAAAGWAPAQGSDHGDRQAGGTHNGQDRRHGAARRRAEPGAGETGQAPRQCRVPDAARSEVNTALPAARMK